MFGLHYFGKRVIPDLEDDYHTEEQKFLEVGSPSVTRSDTERWTFSSRILGIMTLALLFSSRILLNYQCSVSRSRRDVALKPLVVKWRVVSKQKKIPVSIRASKNSRIGSFIHPGDIVESYGDGTPGYMLLVEPKRGFVLRKDKILKHANFERVKDEVESPDSSCPLLYDGWWPENKRVARFVYAPVTMVISQQFWNAMQVFEILLLFSLVYSIDKKSRNLFTICMVSIVTICLLPFSQYVNSTGGNIFSYVTLFTCIWAIRYNTKLEIGIGGKLTNIGHKSVVREELIAFICNLCCSLYNQNASMDTWPNWKRHFDKLDNFLGLVDDNIERPDYYNPIFYTMGISSHSAPMYISRNAGSVSGANVFVVIWSFLPLMYVCYFGCLYLLSSRSPYKNFQRFLCMFGIFHFLFLTDVVSYGYGRGFQTPSSELFHWSERWAWRVAILLPIYQNYTTGHWIKGHSKPIVGKVVHYIVCVWGTCFFLQQVLFSDVERFVQFLNGWEQKSLTKMMGLPWSRMFSYHGVLVAMFITYGIVLFGGFSNYKVFVSRPKNKFVCRV